MTTIRDVAKKAGVSLGTASQAINGKRKVSTEAMAKVMEAVKELNYESEYRPTTRTPLIGLYTIVHKDDEPDSGFLYRIVSSVIQAAEEIGYRVLVRTIKEPAALPPDIISPGARSTMEGAIIYSLLQTPDGFYDFAQDVNFPLVLLGVEHPDLHSVVIDNCGGMSKAIEHLIRLGHNRIAYVTHGGMILDDKLRRLGYEAAMEKHGLDKAILRAEELRDFYAKNEPHTALACFDDGLAVIAVRTLEDMGLKVPGDVSVIGFGNLGVFQRAYPELASVYHPVEEHAKAAVRLLSSVIEGQLPQRAKLELACSLKISGTIGLPAQGCAPQYSEVVSGKAKGRL